LASAAAISSTREPRRAGLEVRLELGHALAVLVALGARAVDVVLGRRAGRALHLLLARDLLLGEIERRASLLERGARRRELGWALALLLVLELGHRALQLLLGFVARGLLGHPIESEQGAPHRPARPSRPRASRARPDRGEATYTNSPSM
jgi:hypothetical protein